MHLVADNLGWFGEERNIEELSSKMGQSLVKVGSGDAAAELMPDDLKMMEELSRRLAEASDGAQPDGQDTAVTDSGERRDGETHGPEGSSQAKLPPSESLRAPKS